MRNGNQQASTLFDILKADLPASLVVFLVALPLCLGIAIASGAPPIAGILSGIIGGLVVATLGGCRMQVSGPANGLIVLVLLVTQTHGLEILGIVVLAAGAVQLLAGLLRTGQLFRAIPPAIIHGLMTGFAVIIFASQFHVMLDSVPRGGALENIMTMPAAVWEAVVDWDGGHQAAAIGILTIVILLVWPIAAPKQLRFLPASLVAVVTATAVAASLSLSIARVTLPDNLLGAIHLIDLSLLPRLLEMPILQMALIMAFLASTESLLSANAVDRLHQGGRTNYDRELAAQGVGNMLCGILGAIPLTGVIIRSAANVAAGGQTRLSSVLHGVWLLVFVVLLPGILMMVPTACLAAVLVVAVFKLINIPALRDMWQHDRGEILIYAATAGTIVFFGVLPGVVLGIVLAIGKLLYRMSHLDIHLEYDPEDRSATLSLKGTATFISLPKLAAALDSIPPGTELHVRFDDMDLIDHACLNLLLNWERKRDVGSSLVIDWESLTAKVGQQPPKEKSVVVVQEAKADTQPASQERRFFRSGWKAAASLTGSKT